MPQERRAMAVMATAANWRIDIRKPSLHSEARDHQFLRGRPKIKQPGSGQSGTGEELAAPWQQLSFNRPAPLRPRRQPSKLPLPNGVARQ